MKKDFLFSYDFEQVKDISNSRTKTMGRKKAFWPQVLKDIGHENLKGSFSVFLGLVKREWVKCLMMKK